MLLRAQIARISADTVVCMKGHLVADEDDPMIVSIDPEFGEGVTAMSAAADLGVQGCKDNTYFTEDQLRFPPSAQSPSINAMGVCVCVLLSVSVFVLVLLC